jgi:hypothetical protein
MKEARFAPEAREEFDAAADWYEGQARGLSERFMSAVNQTVGGSWRPHNVSSLGDVGQPSSASTPG